MEPIVLALERAVAPLSTSNLSDAARAPTATNTTRPRRRWPIAAAAVAIAAALAGGAAIRGRSVRPAPACYVEAVRSVPLARDDRAAVLPGGALAVARGAMGDAIPRFEQDTSGSFAPITLDGDAEFWNAHLHGVDVGGKPALVMQGDQRGLGLIVWLWRPDFPLFGGIKTAMRIDPASIIDWAATGLDDETVLLVTTGHNEGRDWAVKTWVLADRMMHQTIANDLADGPVIAATKDRIAIAFTTDDAIRVVFVNRFGARVGDTLTAVALRSQPVLAFAGETLVVFFGELRGGAIRLRETTLAPGATAFGAPRDAVDDPIVDLRPTATRLASGEWAIAWVAARGGTQTVRVSPVGEGGRLIGPTDVGDVADAGALDSAVHGEGLDVAWSDGATHTLKVARVFRARH
jgi:hypothetical protein